MPKNISKKQLLSPRLPLLDVVNKAQQNLASQDNALLLTFWGSKGCGRTTFLNVVKEKFSMNSKVGIAGFWDASRNQASDLSSAILKAVNNQDAKQKLVLIDNLDALLKTDGGDFFEFESGTILKLIERGDTLIVTSSEIEIHFWQEYDVRERQKNYQLIPLKANELEGILNETDIDDDHAYQMTLGHPKILEALLDHSTV